MPMPSIEYLRSFRIMEYAIFDLVITFVPFIILGPLFSKGLSKLGLHVPVISWFFWALPIGMIVHVIAGAMTPMTVNLLDTHGHYVLKIVMIVLVLLGMRGIYVIR